MLMVTRDFGQADDSVATDTVEERDGSLTMVGAGSTLNRYPWERAIKERTRLEQLRGRSYPAPLRQGPTLVGRPAGLRARMLIELARHGQSPEVEAQASVADLLNWFRSGNDVELAVKQEAAARHAAVAQLATRPLQADVKGQNIDSVIRSHVNGTLALAQSMMSQPRGLQVRRGKGR